jgi:hypothetical protein
VIRQVKPGEPFPDLIHHGDLIPVGGAIRIGHPTGQIFEQTAPRTWVEQSGRAGMDSYYLNGPNWLYKAEAESIDIPLESVEAFRWRLRDSALGAADRSGVAIAPVVEMCAAFGASNPVFTEGGIVSSRTDVDLLPNGTLLYAGHPDLPKLLNVFEKTGTGTLARILGTRDWPAGHPLTIHSIPGYTPPAPEPVADDETLTRIALRAYRVGKTYQRNNSWCGTFDNCLAGLGITDKVFAGIGATTKGPGDTLDREEVARMPEGTLLWWRWRGGRAFAVYIRDDSARNISKTRRVHGYDDDGAHTHGHMVVVQTPEEPMAWRIDGFLAAHLPDGVTVRINGADRTLNAEVRRQVVNYFTYQVTGWPL